MEDLPEAVQRLSSQPLVSDVDAAEEGAENEEALEEDEGVTWMLEVPTKKASTENEEKVGIGNWAGAREGDWSEIFDASYYFLVLERISVRGFGLCFPPRVKLTHNQASASSVSSAWDVWDKLEGKTNVESNGELQLEEVTASDQEVEVESELALFEQLKQAAIDETAVEGNEEECDEPMEDEGEVLSVEAANEEPVQEKPLMGKPTVGDHPLELPMGEPVNTESTDEALQAALFSANSKDHQRHAHRHMLTENENDRREDRRFAQICWMGRGLEDTQTFNIIH